jgi:hypothetical protein
MTPTNNLLFDILLNETSQFNTFLENTIGFEDDIIRCEKLRTEYKNLLLKKGYKTTDLDASFVNFPIDISKHPNLLGGLIAQLPYTQYLEKTCDKKKLLIKLNNDSENKELNFLSSILRENINFQNVILVFDYDEFKENNFLSLNHIQYNGNKITCCDNLWLELLQSAFTELFLIIEIEHSIWHLNVAFIINAAQKALGSTEILNIFAMAEYNVFEKASEVENLLFGTSIIFQQVLSNNKLFNEYVNIRNTLLFNNFNIKTFFDEYLLNNLNLKCNKWIIGLDSNIKIIEDFVSRVVNKTDITEDNNKLIKYIEEYNKEYNLDYQNVSIEKYLQMLFVFGAGLHSTTFLFTKEIFTDLIYNIKFSKEFYEIAIQTITTDIETSFGDVSLYKGSYYINEVNYLFKTLENNRKIIQEELEYSKFKNYNFSIIDDILYFFLANTYTTYV